MFFLIIHLTDIKCLICAGYCLRHWGHRSRKTYSFGAHGNYIGREETKNIQVNIRGEKVTIENKKGKGIEGDRGGKEGSGILLVS